MRRSAALLVFCASSLATAAAALYLMPAPAEVRRTGQAFVVTGELTWSYPEFHDTRLESALARMLRRWEERTGLEFRREGASFSTARGGRATLLVECASAGPRLPALHEDEAYTLTITSSRIVLRSATTTGALRGLETLGQCLVADGKRWALPGAVIEDRPRFPWRGLMIDVCRHWQPLEALKRNIDGMALVKLNVLHLHLSDDEAFRIECRTHPELHEQGSDGHFFTQEQIRELIAYAADRGIRVVPEFDLPGHCTSWLVSHPELAAAPGKYSLARGLITSAPVLDATSEEVHALLADVYAEMAALFPDPYFHIGGDEANYLPWTENARIQNFIREHGLNGPAGLQALFARRLRELLIHQGKQVVGWEEVMRGDMPKDVVIQGWSGPEGEGHGHLDALRNGYRALLSNGYYLDLNHPAALLYQNEPWRGEQLPEGVKSEALLGGEATIWTEWVSQETLDSRIWPRTAAFAERLWSPRDIVDLDDMYRRLAIVSQRLEEAGLAHEKNRGPMVRRLAGSSATPEELRALSDFVDLVEPVKEYNRAKQQGGLNYLRALNSVADCARPESETGRQFTSQVNRFLGSRTETNLASALRTRLQTWAASARVTARFLSRQTTTDPAAAAVAENLLELCDGALTAIDALESSHRAEPEWSARFLTEVQTMEPGRDGILIPIVPAVRRLVEAARTQ